MSGSQHKRRSIRLKGYDYAQSGLYFIPICCQNRVCIFGHIENGIMIKNHAGQIAHNHWKNTIEIRNNIELHEFVVMPNHIHGIFEIVRTTPIIETNHVRTTPDVDPNITIPVGATLVVDQNITNPVMATPTVNPNKTNPVGATLVVDPYKNDSPTVDQNNIDKGQPQGIAPTEKTVGQIVGAFKSITSVEYIRGVKNSNWQTIDKKLWQRNYHEHIIRNEQSYIHISNYIANNPVHWDNEVLQ